MYTYIGSISKLLVEETFETTVYPNKNYVQEIIPLFTVGLEKTNLDGTLILDQN